MSLVVKPTDHLAAFESVLRHRASDLEAMAHDATHADEGIWADVNPHPIRQKRDAATRLADKLRDAIADSDPGGHVDVFIYADERDRIVQALRQLDALGTGVKFRGVSFESEDEARALMRAINDLDPDPWQEADEGSEDDRVDRDAVDEFWARLNGVDPDDWNGGD